MKKLWAGIGKGVFKIYEVLVRALMTPLVILFPGAFSKIRFLSVATEWIGHLVEEPDMFVKSLRLGLLPEARYYWIVFPGDVANPCLLDHWRPHIRIVDGYWTAHLLYPVSRIKSLKLSFNEAIMKGGGAASYPLVQAGWKGREAILKLDPVLQEKGKKILASWGLPEDGWFVCFHNREGGFKVGSDTKRNGDIATYIEAMEYVTQQGGWCIRVGDASMTPLPKMSGVIDYALSADKSEWLDIFLFASCRFFIGGCSGPPRVAAVFGVKMGQVNAAPLSHVFSGGIDEICLPKLCYSDREKRFLAFHELLAGNEPDPETMVGEGLRFVDNTGEDIREVTREIFERSAGTFLVTEDDEMLQRSFAALLRPMHRSYGSPCRIGREFLRKHRQLLIG